jgi:hypothetical protein
MSFEDTRWDIEQTVIQPLRNFRHKAAPLNQIHNYYQADTVQDK